jgi:hypothetical protein
MPVAGFSGELLSKNGRHIVCEGTSRGFRCTTCRENGVEFERFHLPVAEHLHKGTAGEFRAALPKAHQCNAKAGDGGGSGTLVCGSGQTALDSDGLSTSVSPKRARVQSDTCRAHDHLMPGKAFGRFRHSRPCHVGRRGDKPARPALQSTRHEAPIHQRSEAKRDIDALGHQVLVAIVQQQIDVQHRMKRHEGRQPRNHFSHAETQWQRNAQRSTQLTSATRGVIGLLQRRQDRLDSRQVARARLGQGQPSRGARDQARPYLTLEFGGDARCGGLGKAKLPPRPREAPRAGDALEKPKGQETVAHPDSKYILVAAVNYPF